MNDKLKPYGHSETSARREVESLKRDLEINQRARDEFSRRIEEYTEARTEAVVKLKLKEDNPMVIEINRKLEESRQGRAGMNVLIDTIQKRIRTLEEKLRSRNN